MRWFLVSSSSMLSMTELTSQMLYTSNSCRQASRFEWLYWMSWCKPWRSVVKGISIHTWIWKAWIWFASEICVSWHSDNPTTYKPIKISFHWSGCSYRLSFHWSGCSSPILTLIFDAWPVQCQTFPATGQYQNILLGDRYTEDMVRSYSQTWFITKDNVRRTNTREKR